MPFIGELSALLTACLWSGSSLSFASATKRAGSVMVNVTRLILAAVYLILVVGLAALDVQLSLRQVLFLSASGIVGLALGDSCLFKAYQQIGARITMLVMSLAPAIAALLAFLVLGEGLSLIGGAGIAVTLIGIGIVVLERDEQNGSDAHSRGRYAGILLAFLAAVCQGAGLVLAKIAFLESSINGFVATLVRIIASIIVLLPAAILAGRYKHPVKTFIQDKKSFALTIVGSILGPFLGITFSLIAIEYTSVGVAATIMATVPILMLPLVRVIYKERLCWRAILGAFVAVGGVAILFAR